MDSSYEPKFSCVYFKFIHLHIIYMQSVEDNGNRINLFSLVKFLSFMKKLIVPSELKFCYKSAR